MASSLIVSVGARWEQLKNNGIMQGVTHKTRARSLSAHFNYILRAWLFTSVCEDEEYLRCRCITGARMKMRYCARRDAVCIYAAAAYPTQQYVSHSSHALSSS